MIRRLSPELLKIRSAYLRDVRAFFFERDYIEVETPLLNPTGSVEPFLDSMSVNRPGTRKSVQASAARDAARVGYLITSPEYNLKVTLRDLRDNVFQIAHCFRAGEEGDLHGEEFLMLEWYRPGADEFELMAECGELLKYLAAGFYAVKKIPGEISARSVRSIMTEYCGCGLERGELERTAVRRGLLGPGEHVDQLRYDELFFSLFLNDVETRLGRGGPEFIYHYPRELAALAVIEGDICRRFELYWDGLELANGYFELTSRDEQLERFNRENELRRTLGKIAMIPDNQLLEALGPEFPACSGIALGLDRLLMALLGKSTLAEVSPFP